MLMSFVVSTILHFTSSRKLNMLNQYYHWCTIQSCPKRLELFDLNQNPIDINIVFTLDINLYNSYITLHITLD